MLYISQLLLRSELRSHLLSFFLSVTRKCEGLCVSADRRAIAVLSGSCTSLLARSISVCRSAVSTWTTRGTGVKSTTEMERVGGLSTRLLLYAPRGRDSLTAGRLVRLMLFLTINRERSSGWLVLLSRHPLRLSAGSTDIFGIFLVAVLCFAMVSSYFVEIAELDPHHMSVPAFSASILQAGHLSSFWSGLQRVRAQASGYDGFCPRFSC